MSLNIYGMTDEDLYDLALSKQRLENSGFSAKIIDLIGSPIESGLARLPESLVIKINKIAKNSAIKALKYSMMTLKNKQNSKPHEFEHKIAAALSGGAGGFFGIAGLAIELPLTTMITLRSIGDIARSEGEAIDSAEGKLECLEVFALGEKVKKGRASIGYYGIRALLANEIAEAAKHIAARGLSGVGAPAVVRFVNMISSRFGIAITEKAALQALPILGAAGGGIINYLFIEHFQNLAKGHFSVRRLERKYGDSFIKSRYLNLGNL